MTKLTRTINLHTMLTEAEIERRIAAAREELLIELFRQFMKDDIAFRVSESRAGDDYAVVVQLVAEAVRVE